MSRICVLGLGYIGLPTAAMFATHGFEVIGVDINGHIVETLSNGDVHIQEPGLKTLVRAALQSGNLRIAGEPGPADAFIIAVPTPFERNTGPACRSGATSRPSADLRYVVSAAESVVPHLRPRSLVVLESTVPPRTTVEVLLPILSRCGLSVAGAPGSSDAGQILVAHCPERVLPGRILEELVRNDRLVGGVDRASAEAAGALYASFVEGETLLTDATTAETVKLMENTYRDVNIALANEFSLVAQRVGIDVWQAIELANRHPRVNILRPGPGVGGHCIAVDPWFLVQAAPDVTPLIQVARQVNDSMPARVVEQVREALKRVDRPVIACLGLTYKADVDDVRESPSVQVVRHLVEAGYSVRAFDPYVRHLDGLEGVLAESLGQALAGASAVLVLTDHRLFRELPPGALEGAEGRLVLDTRHCLRSQPRP